MKRIDRQLNAALIIGRARERLARIAAGTLRVNAEVLAAWTTIAALPPDIDPAVIDGMDFCGNTWVFCDSCGDLVSAVVEMGEDVMACRDCLIAALELLPEPREVMP